MKVIFRADDVGYTHVHNLGTYKTVEQGITTHVDVMLDGFAAEEALEYFRDKPWISVGWHTHFACRPVLPPEEIPSCVDEKGRLLWSISSYTPMNNTDNVVYEEILKECYAEAERCRAILGRYPDTCGNPRTDNALGRALKTVCDDLKIPYGFEGGTGAHGMVYEVKEEYKDLNIKEYFTSGIHPATPKLRVENFAGYDPAAAIIDMPIEDDVIWERSQHPGYLDDLVLADQGTHCSIFRVQDVLAYTDQRVIDWIKANHIELVSRNDALHGTSTYQDHLKDIDSPLWIGNMQ